jgi:hypothetical protein
VRNFPDPFLYFIRRQKNVKLLIVNPLHIIKKIPFGMGAQLYGLFYWY